MLELNENQLKAVQCDLRPTLVIAGPGSGKTQVLINRINYIIKELKCTASNILVVTFSKLAANEMKERYNHSFGLSKVTFGTLHSVFYRILRQSNPTRYELEHLISENDHTKVLRQLLTQLDSNEGEEFIQQFNKHVSLMKNQLISPTDYEPTEISKPLFLELLKRYEAYKEYNKLFDFDDMLVECYYLLKNNETLRKKIGNQYRYVLIDEFQDINLAQFEVIRLIVQNHQHLFVVGDDDQSIYHFRGAKPEYLLNFTTYYPNAQTFYLTTNYRCSEAILKDSLLVINQNKKRYKKQLVTPNAFGQLPQLEFCNDQRDEAKSILKEIARLYNKENVPLNEIAIIYRTNIQARAIVELLLDTGISFYLRDGVFSLYDQWVTKDILSYLYLAQGIQVTQNACRILNKPLRYISRNHIMQAQQLSTPFLDSLLTLDLSTQQKKRINTLILQLKTLNKLPLLEAIKYIRNTINYTDYVKEYADFRKMPVQSLLDILDEIEDSAKSYKNVQDWEQALIQMNEQMKRNARNHTSDAIILTTMHGSKGLEFDTVFVLDVVNKIVPHYKSTSIQELEEERRLLYVSMTRAKQRLYFYIPKQRYGKAIAPSPFIKVLIDAHNKENLSKLSIGQKFRHNKLGLGRIIKILDNNIILAKFSNNQQRKLDSQYCLNNAIMKWEDDSDEEKKQS